MQLIVQPYEKAQPIKWNFDELKAELTAKLESYKTLQYTAEQIAAAKTDRAGLNNLKKALNDERIRREKEFLEPFNLFKAQISELITLIDEPCKLIDRQVKEFEEMEKREKRNACISIFDEIEDKPEWLQFEQIENPRWQNKTASEKSIRDEMAKRISQINGEVAIINGLDFAFEAMDEYKRSLDASKALTVGKRFAELQAAKAEAERQMELPLEQTETPEIPFVDGEVVEITADETKGKETAVWLKFEALLTISQAAELKSFFRFNGIDYKPIKEG